MNGSLLTRLRESVRKWLFRLLHKVLNHDAGREVLVDSLRGLVNRPAHGLDRMNVADMPYPDVGTYIPQASDSQSDNAVFVTGRFRSGSTLLWSIFRNIVECTAYYEPFNERRWFDAEKRGGHVDESHRGVTDYWAEYEGMEDLGQHYDENWIHRRLVMDARSWDPGMKSFIKRLIERKHGRAVLQFNRIDFRLPWIRHHFPNAKIVHIFRHPRDQWCSTLSQSEGFAPEAGSLEDFVSADKFYLRVWVNDLKYRFPFLQDASLHPYRHFYWIWKLSYLYGRKYSDHSLSYEQLVSGPRISMEPVFDELQFNVTGWDTIESLVEKPSLGKWNGYADGDWFRHHEAECERTLSDFLRGETQPTDYMKEYS